MEKLILNGWTYYHTTETTSPFGGVMQSRTLFRVNSKGIRVSLTTEEWNKELTELMTPEQYDKSYDMIYEDPFVDYR